MSALQLEEAPDVLGPLIEELVFVGGATVHLWITEPGAPPVRATELRDYIREELIELKGKPYFSNAVESATATYGSLG